MNPNMPNPGFKRITTENWLDPDPLMEVLVKRDRRDGSIHPVAGEDWIAYVNRIELSTEVPIEVHDAFHFIVGAIGYAYYYYPVFTIVSQQVLRVADFAIDKLFDAHLIKRPQSFARRLEILKGRGLLSESEATRWGAIKDLRNSATHPVWQQNWGLPSLDTVRVVAEAISALPWPKGTEIK